MNDRDKIIEQLIKEKGGTKQQYLQLMDSIGYHESAGTLDPKTKQYGGGPGRGKYQFEIGKAKGGITAANRTKTYYKDKGMPVPQWLNAATKGKSLDVTNLTSEQQDVLFLGNMRGHPTANFSKVWNGKESVPEFWANYHWSGDKADRRERINSFNESYKDFESKNTGFENKLTTEAPKALQQDGNYYIPENKSYDLPRKNITDERSHTQQPTDGTYINQPIVKDYPSQDNNLPKLDGLLKDSSGDLFSYLKEKEKYNNINTNSYTGNDIKNIPNDNQFMMGGYNGQSGQNDLNEYNAGGRHEQNPYGGIPQGVGSNGKMNTVEQGETSFELSQGKFIFSDRLNTSGGNTTNKNNEYNDYKHGGNLNYDKSKNFLKYYLNHLRNKR